MTDWLSWDDDDRYDREPDDEPDPDDDHPSLTAAERNPSLCRQ